MWLDLQIFGFRALWSPIFMSFIIGLGILYFVITGPLRHRFGGDDKPTGKQQLCFYSGLLLLYVVKGSPIDLLTHIMLSAHMLQMVFYYFVFPILIIKGIPVWIWRKVLENRFVRPIFRFVTKPLIALLMFNILFSLYHMPAIFDFSKSSQMAHTSISIVLLVLAFIMYWPIVGPFVAKQEMMPLLKMAYLMASAAIITISCALIIFAPNPLFDAYSSEGAWIQAMALCVPGDVLGGLPPHINGPELFSPLTIENDQQLGGIIMKIVQEAIYGVIIGKIFFSWFTKKSLEVDPLPTEAITESH